MVTSKWSGDKYAESIKRRCEKARQFDFPDKEQKTRIGVIKNVKQWADSHLCYTENNPYLYQYLERVEKLIEWYGIKRK